MNWRRALVEADRLDVALYTTIAKTETPSLDRRLRMLSDAADHSKISMAIAGGLTIAGGAKGRRAAARGVAAVAVTSLVVNAVIKPLTNRRRPDRVAAAVLDTRHVSMPKSDSFPSGHTAAAFAFAVGTGSVLPRSIPPLTLLAALVSYSRVHTGVHYPGDVAAGLVCGVALATATNMALDRQIAKRLTASAASASPAS